MTDTVEATAIEDVGTELAPVAQGPGANLFRSDDPNEIVTRAKETANALSAVIDSQGLFTNIQGKKHVRVEGWTLCGSMLGVTAVVTSTRELANGWEARCEARTLDGRVIGAGDAMCTRDEKRWKTADDYAVRSMAQTRATSKALKGPLGFIVSLAGFAPTPAEEMDGVVASAGGDAKPGGRCVTENQLEKFIKPNIRRKGIPDEQVSLLLKHRFKVERLEDLPISCADSFVGALGDPIPTGEDDLASEHKGPVVLAENPDDLPFS